MKFFLKIFFISAIIFAAVFVVLSGVLKKQAHAAGYSYSRAITVTSNTSIASGTQANFPMLVSSTISSWATASNGGHVQNLVTAPNGGQEPADFIFTSDSGCSSPLNFETESYSSSTGALVDWVNVPSLSAGTVIYACYGNAAVTTDQSNPSATWNANYQFVYHFPTVPGGSLNAFDSTQFANAATTQNNVAATASGLAGGGIFYSSNYGSNLENSYTQTNVSTYTEEAWIKTSEVNGFVQPIIDDRNGFASPSMSLFLEGSGACGGSCGPAGSGDLVVGMDTDNVFYGDYASAEALTDGNWHHVVATLSQAIGTAIVPASFNLYIDGVQQSLTPINLAGQIYSPFTASGGTWVGYEPAWSYNFEGTMDEVRVSTAALSPSWIATEYNNQNNPSAFYAVGSENANAASSFTWTGAGGNANWSTGANWSGGAAPGATSTATFDGTCSSNCSPTIDTSINIGGISMSSAYHGTITQASGSSITIGSSGFTQGGGTFVASANRDAITVNGSFTESAGMFTSTAGNLTIAGDMMLSGQTFNANGGTTTLDANGYSPTLTCGSSSLGSLTIAITGGTLNIPNNCTVAGNLLSNSGGVFEKPSSTATVAVRGNFTQTGGLFGEANLTLSLVGSATSTIAQSIGTTIGANLNISKTGTIPVQLASDLIVTGANCTVSTGTLDMNSHSFTCFGALAINSGGWLADYPTATSTLTTGAGVTNNGVMFLDGTGLGYASPYPRYMNILSTVSGTQSYWSSGAGEFIIRSATIKDQGGTFTKGASQIPVWNGALTNDSGELFVPSSVGRPQLVESTTPAWSGSGVSSLALPAFTYWPKAGDLILVAVSAYGQTIVAPTDNASNTYLLATSTTFGSPSNAVSLYYAQNVNSTSSFVVTLHATVPSGGIQLLSGQAYEFTGMAATSTFDAASQNIDTSGSAVSLSSGNATGRSAHDELFFGAATIGSTIATVTGTPFSGWTSLSGVPSTGSQQGLFPEYQSVPSPSTLAAPWSASTSTTYGAVLGVFDSPAGSRGYAASGTLDSAIFDTKSVLGAQLNSVVWYGSALNGTSVGLQFAVSNSSAGPWTFEGPSGDATTYFAGAAGSSIPLVSNIGGAGYSMFSGYEYFRYRLLFSSDPTHMYTPTVTGVNVNWSP